MTKELGYTPITGDQVLKMTPEEIAAQQFQAWVESRVWVFAKTMPEHRHFYTAINRKRDDAETIARFEDAVIFVNSMALGGASSQAARGFCISITPTA